MEARPDRRGDAQRVRVVAAATVTTASPCCRIEHPYRLALLAQHGWIFAEHVCPNDECTVYEHERAAFRAELIDAAVRELARLAGVQVVETGAGGAVASGGEGEASSVTAASSPGAEVWFGGAPSDLLPAGYAAASTLPCVGWMGEDC